MVAVIMGALGIIIVGFSVFFVKDILAHKESLEKHTDIITTAGIGFVTNFLDTLGIGSFAPMTALLHGFRQIRDRVIPGTLNVSCTLPVAVEAFIFINIIRVETITLFLIVSSAVTGAFISAGIVAKLPEKKIQLIMGIALLVTALFMISGQMDWIEGLGTGEAIGLLGCKLAIACAVSFLLGALQSAGIGLYAPCMALVYALGMSPRVAFPIMMASSAFTLPPAAVRYIREGAYNRKASLVIGVVGIAGVFIAAFIVKSLPLTTLTWLVILVIIYTTVTLLVAAFKKQRR